jgi:hypothetical protein
MGGCSLTRKSNDGPSAECVGTFLEPTEAPPGGILDDAIRNRRKMCKNWLHVASFKAGPKGWRSVGGRIVRAHRRTGEGVSCGRAAGVGPPYADSSGESDAGAPVDARG